MRNASAAVLACLIFSGPASAQSFNFGVGLTEETRSNAGPAMWYFAGADIPLSERLTLRSELGSRWPGSRRTTTDAARVFTTHVEDSIFDLALLLRFGTSEERSVQFGVFAGPHVEFVKSRTTTLFPPTGLHPNGVETVLEKNHWVSVLDVGIDAGARIDDKWTLLAYAVAGVRPAPNEDGTVPLRAGVMAKRRF